MNEYLVYLLTNKSYYKYVSAILKFIQIRAESFFNKKHILPFATKCMFLQFMQSGS